MFQLMHLYALKRQLTLTFKTLKKTVKTLLVTLPLHISVHSFDHPQGAHMPNEWTETCRVNFTKMFLTVFVVF